MNHDQGGPVAADVNPNDDITEEGVATAGRNQKQQKDIVRDAMPLEKRIDKLIRETYMHTSWKERRISTEKAREVITRVGYQTRPRLTD